MTLKIGSFVINCKDFDKTYKFWQEALHYVPRRPPGEGWVVLKDPTGTSPNVSVNQTEELKFGRNRMHLDLYATDQKAEVERLIKLGATIHKPAKQGEDLLLWPIRKANFSAWSRFPILPLTRAQVLNPFDEPNNFVSSK